MGLDSHVFKRFQSKYLRSRKAMFPDILEIKERLDKIEKINNEIFTAKLNHIKTLDQIVLDKKPLILRGRNVISEGLEDIAPDVKDLIKYLQEQMNSTRIIDLARKKRKELLDYYENDIINRIEMERAEVEANKSEAKKLTHIGDFLHYKKRLEDDADEGEAEIRRLTWDLEKVRLLKENDGNVI